jgi:hypothetical protein
MGNVKGYFLLGSLVLKHHGTRREGYCETQSSGNLNDVLQMSILGHKYRFLTAAV